MGSDIQQTLDRWNAKGLIDAELAQTLAAEAKVAERAHGKRTVQYFLAASAAVIVMVAAGVFLSVAWPSLGEGVRTAVLVAGGFAMLVGGKSLEGRSGLAPVGYLLQTAGMGLLLFAYVYSENAWGNDSPLRFAIAAMAFLTPLLTVMLAIRSNHVMPAVNAGFAYAFLMVALHRLGIDAETGLWIVDAALLATLAVLAHRLLRSRDPESRQWELSAFIASLFAGFPLVGFTAAEAMNLNDQAVFALDLWWAVTVAVVLWAMHAAPVWLRRPWYETLLAGCVLIAIGLSAWTLDQLGLDSDLLALGPALVGAAALAYGLRHEAHPVLACGCVALVIAAWWFGVANGRAFGAVIALAFTAAVLFWLAARLGKDVDEPEAA